MHQGKHLDFYSCNLHIDTSSWFEVLRLVCSPSASSISTFFRFHTKDLVYHINLLYHLSDSLTSSTELKNSIVIRSIDDKLSLKKYVISMTWLLNILLKDENVRTFFHVGDMQVRTVDVPLNKLLSSGHDNLEENTEAHSTFSDYFWCMHYLIRYDWPNI